MAVAADIGMSLIVTLNGLRLLAHQPPPSDSPRRDPGHGRDASSAAPSCACCTPVVEPQHKELLARQNKLG